MGNRNRRTKRTKETRNDYRNSVIDLERNLLVTRAMLLSAVLKAGGSVVVELEDSDGRDLHVRVSSDGRRAHLAVTAHGEQPPQPPGPQKIEKVPLLLGPNGQPF